MDNFLSLIGFILPPVIDLINRKIEDRDARFWISVLFCSVVGVVVYYAINRTISIDGMSAQILITFGEAQLIYKALWENSEARKELKLKN